ncbi:MAG: endonuclease NucS domain-containing protein [Nitrososphaeria archaeon]|jgi:RecB family endonuclease NucS
MVNIVFYPLLEKAVRSMEESLRAKKFIVCLGLFSVEYIGRSSSYLGFGERLLIVKEDGSVIVHRRNGHEPVNWQPRGCVIKCSLLNDTMMVLSERRKPKEFLKMVFEEVYVLMSSLPVDDAKFLMGPTEKTFYKILYSNPDFIEKGLKLVSKQKAIPSGIPDFTGVDLSGNYVLIEVKRCVAGIDAVKQLDRYIKNQPGKFRGILCAPSITRSAASLLNKKGYAFKRLDFKALSRLIILKPYVETLDEHLNAAR